MNLDPQFVLFIILAFVSIFLAIEAIYIWWREKHSNEARRLNTRLLQISNDDDLFIKQHSILKNRLQDNKSWRVNMLKHLIDIHKLDALLLQSGKLWTVQKFLNYTMVGLLAGLVLGFMINRGAIITLILMALLTAWPLIYILYERDKRIEKIQKQLPEAIDSIARSLKAGHSFMGAFSMIGEELSDPIATEFRITLEESNLGVPLSDALLNFSNRIPLTDLKFFVIAILIQRESGGNLAEILTSMSKIIRERFKLMGEVRTLSAEGRTSAWVMWLMPFFMMGIMSALSPSYAPILFGTESGQFLLKVGLVLMILAAIWMRKIVKIKV